MEIINVGEELWINDIRLKHGENWMEGDRLKRLLENPVTKVLSASGTLVVPSQAYPVIPLVEVTPVAEELSTKKRKVNDNSQQV